MGFLKGPIEKQLKVKGEFERPIDIGQLQDVIDAGMAPYRKREPELSAAIQRAAVEAAATVIRDNDGTFTLKALERWSDTVQLGGSGVAKLVDKRMRDSDVQVSLSRMADGVAMLAKFLVAWANDGRPEIDLADKQQLSIAAIRTAIASVEGKEREYIATLLDAIETAQPGRTTISLRDLEDIHRTINAASAPIKERIEVLEKAHITPDKALKDEHNHLVLQSLGAYRLKDFLDALNQLGELQTLAAAVKPGADEALGRAAG